MKGGPQKSCWSVFNKTAEKKSKNWSMSRSLYGQRGGTRDHRPATARGGEGKVSGVSEEEPNYHPGRGETGGGWMASLEGSKSSLLARADERKRIDLKTASTEMS